MDKLPAQLGDKVALQLHRTLYRFGLGGLEPMIGMALVGVFFAELGAHVAGEPGTAIGWTGYALCAASLTACFVMALWRLPPPRPSAGSIEPGPAQVLVTAEPVPHDPTGPRSPLGR